MKLNLRLLSLAAPALMMLACTPGPTLTQVFLTPTTLLDTQVSTITITVHHDKGLDELVGAQLYNEDQSYWFGPLGEVSDGTFQTSIGWAELHKAKPIQFDFPITRTLVVVVTDNDGITDEVSVELKLQCRVDQHACDGLCYPDSVDCSDV